MEAETESDQEKLETAVEEADAFQEDVRRYSAEAAGHHRRLRDASAALATERRHRQLLCERLRDADWALDLVLHDAPTRLLAADMLDAGPEGAVRIRHMQEHIAKLENHLRPEELSPESAPGSKDRRVMEAGRRVEGERELRVLDYEEARVDRDRARRLRRRSGSSIGTSSGSQQGRGSGERELRAADLRGQRRRKKGDEAREQRERLVDQLREQQLVARREGRRLAVLREEAEDLRLALDKMRKALRKIRAFDTQLLEQVEQSLQMVKRVEELQESQLRSLQRYSQARHQVSATFQSALRSSQRRRTTLQTALRSSQLQLRSLHHILQHLLPMDGAALPAHFYRGLVEAAELERDVLMERMALLAQRLCRAKGRAQLQWQQLVAVRRHIQAVEVKLTPYGVSPSRDKYSHKKRVSEWTVLRERQLEKELQELQEMGFKCNEAALKVERRYLRDMWALHHLFELALSRMEAALASSAQEVARTSSPAGAAAGDQEVCAEEVAGKAEQGEVQVEEGRRRRQVAGRKKGAATARARKVKHTKQMPLKDKQQKKAKESDDHVATSVPQEAEACNTLLPSCACSDSCLELPDTPCTVLRSLTSAAGKRAPVS